MLDAPGTRRNLRVPGAPLLESAVMRRFAIRTSRAYIDVYFKALGIPPNDADLPQRFPYLSPRFVEFWRIPNRPRFDLCAHLRRARRKAFRPCARPLRQQAAPR